jgi:hypothetical protein
LRPHGRLALFEVGDASFRIVIEPPNVELPHAIPFRSVGKPPAGRRRLGMIMKRTGQRMCQTPASTVKSHAKEFDAAVHQGCLIDRATIGRPHGHVTAAAVDVGHVE